MRWWVYVLDCTDGTLYTGITTDPQRRLSEHERGVGARYTRTRLPVRLAHLEEVGSRSQALRRELEIKQMPRRKKLELIERFPGFP